MPYSVVLGDLGPKMTLTVSGDDFTLSEETDTLSLRYLDPDGDTHEVEVTIADDDAGTCEIAWADGDLPAVGSYVGLITVERIIPATESEPEAPDPTFPRSFPNDGTKIIWWVNETI